MNYPEFDKDGYPTEETLEAIEKWPILEYREWFDFIEEAWEWPNYFVRDGNQIDISTCGWSGNEDIINAMENNVNWIMTWFQSRRGGHYIFKIPEAL